VLRPPAPPPIADRCFASTVVFIFIVNLSIRGSSHAEARVKLDNFFEDK
jgi:hypothetical protein